MRVWNCTVDRCVLVRCERTSCRVQSASRRLFVHSFAVVMSGSRGLPAKMTDVCCDCSERAVLSLTLLLFASRHMETCCCLRCTRSNANRQVCKTVVCVATVVANQRAVEIGGESVCLELLFRISRNVESNCCRESITLKSNSTQQTNQTTNQCE